MDTNINNITAKVDGSIEITKTNTWTDRVNINDLIAQRDAAQATVDSLTVLINQAQPLVTKAITDAQPISQDVPLDSEINA